MGRDSYRQLMWHGALIFLLAALSGWLMVLASVTNPRMMLATHTTALFSALFMMVVGLLGPQLRLGSKTQTTLFWSLVLSQYIFFITGIYSAIAGTSSMFAGPPEMKGTELQETVVLTGNVVGVIGATVSAVLLLWGLRSNSSAQA